MTEWPSGWFVYSKGNDDEKLEVDADIILGCDGAYSALRRELMRRPRWGMQGTLKCKFQLCVAINLGRCTGIQQWE